MRNVILFGNVPLATWVVKQLLKSEYLQLVGVVCDEYNENHFINHGMNEKSLFSFCKENKLKVLSFEEALTIAKSSPILGVSVRFHKLFKEEYFEAFKPGIINLHGGELPRYRGANIANYAVLENACRGAGTLHFISNGIDEGDVVERVFFNTDENETAFSFFTKTLLALQKAFIKFLDNIDHESVPEIKRIPQSYFIEKGEMAKTYYKKGIEKYREISFTLDLDWNDVYLKTKAFHFPNHIGAILVKGDQKIELKLHE